VLEVSLQHTDSFISLCIRINHQVGTVWPQGQLMDILNFGLGHENIGQLLREVVVRPLCGRIEEVAVIRAETYNSRHRA